MPKPLTPYDQLSESTKRSHVRKVTEQHKHVAMLIALGWSNVNVAKEVKLDPARISDIKHSPLVKEWIAYYREQIEDRVLVETITKRLAQEFPVSMDKIAELRDRGEEESTQLQAARFIVDKAVEAVIPKKTINEEVKKVGVFVIDGVEAQRLLNLAKEDEAAAIEVTGEEVEGN